MFINPRFVAIIFKFINFFAIIGLGLFIFKKYFKTDILFSITKKEMHHQDLLTQQAILKDQQRSLALVQQEEMIQCQNFKSKIDEWKRVVISEQQKQAKEHDALLSIIKKRNTEVALKKENQRLQNNIIDLVVSDLEKSVSNDFKSSQKS